jgi:hypothetical protein
MPDLFVASRAELLHRDHVIYELIDGDLGALLPTRRFVCLKVSFIPVQRCEDVASAGSHSISRLDLSDATSGARPAETALSVLGLLLA